MVVREEELAVAVVVDRVRCAGSRDGAVVVLRVKWLNDVALPLLQRCRWREKMKNLRWP